MIDEFGSQELRSKYLPHICSMQVHTVLYRQPPLKMVVGYANVNVLPKWVIVNGIRTRRYTTRQGWPVRVFQCYIRWGYITGVTCQEKEGRDWDCGVLSCSILLVSISCTYSTAQASLSPSPPLFPPTAAGVLLPDWARLREWRCEPADLSQERRRPLRHQWIQGFHQWSWRHWCLHHHDQNWRQGRWSVQCSIRIMQCFVQTCTQRRNALVQWPW